MSLGSKQRRSASQKPKNDVSSWKRTVASFRFTQLDDREKEKVLIFLNFSLPEQVFDMKVSSNDLKWNGKVSVIFFPQWPLYFWSCKSNLILRRHLSKKVNLPSQVHSETFWEWEMEIVAVWSLWAGSGHWGREPPPNYFHDAVWRHTSEFFSKRGHIFMHISSVIFMNDMKRWKFIRWKKILRASKKEKEIP